jgi:hypothetical protein
MENNKNIHKQQALMHRRMGSLKAWRTSLGISALAKLAVLV